jgi:hypothetical protein
MHRKLLLSLIGLVLFACGGAATEPSYSYTGNTSPEVLIPEQQSRRSSSPEAPRKTVVELQTCADRLAPGLSPEHYAVMVDIEVTKHGKPTAVKIKDSMLGGSPLEVCLTAALERMTVPATALNTQNGAPQSRSMVGVVQAAAAPIALLPIVIVSAGVTILVGVTIYVIAESLTEKERCKQVKEFCISKCTDETLPTGTFNGDPFFQCRRRCLEAANCW